MPTANEPSRLGSRQFQKPQLRSPRISFALALCCIFSVFAMYSRSLDFQFVLDDHRFTAEPTPSREFHAAEIWISCGLVSRVFFMQASILARKQSGEVHCVELGSSKGVFLDCGS